MDVEGNTRFQTCRFHIKLCLNRQFQHLIFRDSLNANLYFIDYVIYENWVKYLPYISGIIYLLSLFGKVTEVFWNLLKNHLRECHYHIHYPYGYPQTLVWILCFLTHLPNSHLSLTESITMFCLLNISLSLLQFILFSHFQYHKPQYNYIFSCPE